LEIALHRLTEEHAPATPFRYSDRIRYLFVVFLLARSTSRRALIGMMERLGTRRDSRDPDQPDLARVYPSVVAGKVAPTARELCLAAVNVALDPY